MRRVVAILLLLVLSLQFTWAAAASYCEHDQDTTTQHVGHHEHQHGDVAQVSPSADAPDPEGTKAGAAHADCASCHLSAAKTFSSLEMSVPISHSCAPAMASDAALSAALFERIERPKWQRA
jgi:hypothetical protein